MATPKTKQNNTQNKTRAADASVLKRPRITEKAANAGTRNAYVFDVAVDATKNEIAKAFQIAYKQKPVKVNLVTGRAKSYFRRGVLGFGKRGKKAYVYLPKGVTIEII